jgi:hypothetical protein
MGDSPYGCIAAAPRWRGLLLSTAVSSVFNDFPSSSAVPFPAHKRGYLNFVPKIPGKGENVAPLSPRFNALLALVGNVDA